LASEQYRQRYRACELVERRDPVISVRWSSGERRSTTSPLAVFTAAAAAADRISVHSASLLVSRRLWT